MPVSNHATDCITRLAFHKRRSGRHAGRGAALVEFAVAAPFIFLLFAMIIDGGFYMYRYLRVRHITNQVARELATNAAVRLITEKPAECGKPPVAPDSMEACCAEIRRYACEAAQGFYSSSTDILQRGITLTVNEILPNSWGGIPVIRVQGSMTSSCLICRLIAGSYQIRATSVIGFESERYNVKCSFTEAC